MPLQVDSCYKDMVAALKLAVEATIRIHEAGDVDPELERDAISEDYHWSSHSLRRRADKVARDTQRLLVAAGVAHPKELIDYFFGWKLREMQKDMQLHYAGMDRGGDWSSRGSPQWPETTKKGGEEKWLRGCSTKAGKFKNEARPWLAW